ncbi:MAG: Nramp family divalent metal transporter, partial [Planctomycetota bacterium]|nr:Nramp family divalent metal transporter [Planctomycetota bacterium]
QQLLAFNQNTLIPLLKLQEQKLGTAEELQSIIDAVKAEPILGIKLSAAHFLSLDIASLKTQQETIKKNSEEHQNNTERLNQLATQLANLKTNFPAVVKFLAGFNQAQSHQSNLSDPYDDEIWAALITAVTIAMLVVGRFALIQNFSTALVGMFTLVTVINIILLQSNPSWGFSVNNILDGLKFRLPPESNQGISIALMAFGIIGVGANELVMYPYWCQEKGYGKFVGPNDGSPEWTQRAQGWMRVMRWDAWCSMIIYTFATVAFYLLGACILWRSGLTPEGNDTIRYLSVMYEPVFGPTAQTIFLVGAFAVLYSTFFVANAAHARTFSDALRVIGLAQKTSYRKLVVFFSGFFPSCCILIYLIYPKPVQLVLISGLMQALMLPMLAGAAIYYRYRRIGREMQPGKAWDFFLWLSALGMLVAGLWVAWTKITY